MTFIEWAKTVNWQRVNDVSNSLSDLNDGQWRFAKGLFIEKLVESESKGILKYVGLPHIDFVCDKYNVTVELKSITSDTLYKKRGGLRKNINIIFNNSMGTNKDTINPDHVCDYLIVIKNDGAVVADKQTVLKNLKRKGDGFTLKLPTDSVTELSGHLKVVDQYKLNIKEQILNMFQQRVDNLDTYKVK